MTLSKDNLSLNLTPYQFAKSEDLTISITTDNPTGYTMAIAGESKAEMTSDEGNKIASINSNLSENDFANNNNYLNQWGYRPNQYFNGEAKIINQNFLPAPPASGKIIAITKAPNTSPDTHSLSIGAKVDYELPMDNYSYTYTITATANIVPYTITYNANLEKDTYNIPEPQSIFINSNLKNSEAATLSTLTPFSSQYNFIGWCDQTPVNNECENSLYQPGDSCTINLENAKINTDLYAIWKEIPSLTIDYIYGDEIVFDGKNYLDTDLQLFSSANIQKDFTITSGIKDFVFLPGQHQNLNNVISSMSEAGNPYPGFTFRYTTSNKGQFEMAANNQKTATGPTPKFSFTTTNYISILRKDQILYYGTNDVPGAQGLDYSKVAAFDTPLTFGAGINGLDQPFRYFKGVLTSPTVSFINPYANSVTVTLPLPKLTNQEFAGWYDSPAFTTKIGDGGEEVTFNTKTTLYAKWSDQATSAESFSYPGEITFDGTNHLNTEVHLYSRANINRNFEISFDIVNYDTDNVAQATIMNSLNEFDHNYPGTLMRITTDSTTRTELVSISKAVTKKTTLDNYTGTVKIIRINGSIYYSVNNRSLQWLADINPTADWHNIPVTFGASVDENESPFRNFKGTLANLSVKFLPDSVTIEDYDAPSKATETVFFYAGPYTFDGNSVEGPNQSTLRALRAAPQDSRYIDTGIHLFDTEHYQKDFSISFEINEIASDNTHQATLMNALKEGPVAPWPGTLFRYDLANANNPRLEFDFNKSSSSSYKKYWNQSEIQKITIMRKQNAIYLKINDRIEEKIIDVSNYTATFNTPVTFGASLDENGEPFRFFKGTLSNMEIKLEPDS